MKSTHRWFSTPIVGRLTKLHVSWLLAALTPAAHASPSEGTVTAGTATITNSDPGQWVINQTTNKAIIDWNSFSVGSNESVVFNTPGSSAATLSRVVGRDPSQILGTVSSNGQLWLINSNGILFGRDARVNVAGLLASTLDISDKDFLSGHYQFNASGSDDAAVTNHGTLSANNGYIALLAPQVNNTGLIAAKLGTVALGAGTQATLSFEGNKLLSFQIGNGVTVPMYDQNGQPLAALNQSGTIVADGGQVLLAAQSINSVLNQSINVSGVVQANSVETRNGKIVLLAKGDAIVDNGSLSAQGLNAGESGGKVEVIGRNVGLFGATNIDASGDAGGGEIRIGRDDTDSQAFEANVTAIAPDVHLAAAATRTGNGGFIETSGYSLNVQTSNINTQAANGKAGVWLLDPYDLTISNSPDSGISGSTPFVPSGTSNLNVATLVNALQTSNVLVETGGDVGTGNGDITLNNDVTWSSANSLTLNAYGSIVLNAGLIGQNAGVILTALNGSITDGATHTGSITALSTTLTANGDIDLENPLNSMHAITASTTDTSTARNITLLDSGVVNGVMTDVTVASLDTSANNGDITLVNVGSSLVLAGAVTAGSGTTSLIAAHGSISDNNGAGSISAGTTNLAAGASVDDTASFISLTNSGNHLGTLSAAAYGTDGNGNGITVSDGNTSGLVLADISTVGNLAITASGDLTQASSTAINMGGAAHSSTATFDIAAGQAGAIALTNSTNDFNQNSVSAGGADLLSGFSLFDNDSSGLYLANVSAGDSSHAANVSVTSSGGPILLEGDISAADLTVTANDASSGYIQQVSGTITTSGNSQFEAYGARVVSNPPYPDSYVGIDLLENYSSANQFNSLSMISHGANASAQANGVGATSVSGSTNNGLFNTQILNGTLTVSGSGITSGTGQTLLSINGSGNIAVNGNVTASGLSLDANGGTITQQAGTTLSGPVSMSNASSATLDNTGAVELGAVNVTNLAVTASGDITQSNMLTIAGTTALDAGTHAISLGGLNTFGGTITLGHSGVTAGAIILESGTGGITLAQVDQNTNTKLSSLALNSAGGISQDSALKVTGNTSLAAASVIALTNSNNDFNTLTIDHGGNNVYVTDSNALILNTSSLNNDLVLTTGGDITQTGAVTIGGIATLDAGSHSITLTDLNNDFMTLGITADVADIVDTNALALGTISANSLTLNTGGAITKANSTVAIDVSGATTLNAGTYAIDLGGTNNDFNTVTVNGTPSSVVLSDSNALVLAAMTSSGALSVTTGGDLTQTGAFQVNGATFNAGSHSLTLTNANNDFGNQAVNATGGAVQIVDANATGLTLGNVSATTLTATTGGDLFESGSNVIAVSGATNLTAVGNITLNGANQMHGPVTLSGVDISFSNITDLQLGNVTASGDFSATLFAAVTQANNTAINVTGATNINGESNDVTLANDNNLFGGPITLTGNNLRLTQQAGNDLTLASVNGYGDILISDVGATLTFAGNAPTISLRNGINDKTITLVADHFANQSTGSESPIDVGNGAGNVWQFYLSNLDGNTFSSGSNTLTSGNQAIWNTAYPTAVTLSGNRYIFAASQTLTLSPIANSMNLTVTSGAGTTLPAAVDGTNYSLTGMVNANLYGGVFTQDTATNLFAGQLSFSSTGSSTSAAVGTYDITINAPSTTATGYTVLTHNPYGAITVAAASNTGGGNGGGSGNNNSGGSSNTPSTSLLPDALSSVGTLFNVDAANAKKGIETSFPTSKPLTSDDIELMSQGVNRNLH